MLREVISLQDGPLRVLRRSGLEGGPLRVVKALKNGKTANVRPEDLRVEYRMPIECDAIAFCEVNVSLLLGKVLK